MSYQDDDCIFCKIASGAMGTPFLVESEHVVAFDDISPQAPAHVLVIPKAHYASIHDEDANDSAVWQEMLDAVQRVAEAKGIAESGYRVITNAGPDSGQEVAHLHLHVIGGRKLGPIA
jgi:histidine triad (HIT) family protein